jgi:hypothetical protein
MHLLGACRAHGLGMASEQWDANHAMKCILGWICFGRPVSPQNPR